MCSHEELASNGNRHLTCPKPCESQDTDARVMLTWPTILCCPGDYKTQGLLRFGYVQMNANGAVVGFGEASTVRVASLVHILCSSNSQRSSTFVKDAILGLAAF